MKPAMTNYSSARNSVIIGRVSLQIRGGSMQAKKPSGLVSRTGVIRVMTHAMMGAALGLAFGLILTLTNPAVAVLIHNGGSQAIVVFVMTLVTTFAIGATLTGVVFMLAEDKQF
jgi:hypothetical protein